MFNSIWRLRLLRQTMAQAYDAVIATIVNFKISVY